MDAMDMRRRGVDEDGIFPVGVALLLAQRPHALRAVNVASTSEPKGAAQPPAPKGEEAKPEPKPEPPANQAAAGASAIAKPAEPKPAPAPENKPEPAPAPKPENKPEPAPAPAPENKPAPTPEPKGAENKVDEKPANDAPAPANQPEGQGAETVTAAGPDRSGEPKPAGPDPAAPTPKGAEQATEDKPAAAPASADADPAVARTGDAPAGDSAPPANEQPAKPGTSGAKGDDSKLATADAAVRDAHERTGEEAARMLLASSTTKPGEDRDAAAEERSDEDQARVDAARTADRKELEREDAARADAKSDTDERDRDDAAGESRAQTVAGDDRDPKVDAPDPAKPVEPKSDKAEDLDAITPEQRAEQVRRQEEHERRVAEARPEPPPKDATPEQRKEYDQKVEGSEQQVAEQNRAYYTEQGNQVWIDPKSGTVYQARYENGEVIKTRQGEEVPVGQAGNGSRDVTITEPDAGGTTTKTELTPPKNPDGSQPPVVKSEVRTKPSGDVERAWVDGAEDDSGRLEAALTDDQKQKIADAQPPADANKDQKSEFYAKSNMRVEEDGKLSGAGVDHKTGELTLTRKNERIETSPGVFASRDRQKKLQEDGANSVVGTTYALDKDGTRAADGLRDEIATDKDGAITKSMVTTVDAEGNPKKDDKGNPVPPNAEQLDGALAPETRAALEESQRQHTEKIDALRGELPNPSTEEQRKAYTDNIAKNDAAIREELKRYYGSSNLYVLPTTGEVYNATYDDKTGELHLQRPGLRTDFQGGATENHQFYIEPNGARREVRGIAVDPKDGQPAPAPIEFSTERTFSGEMKGAHLTQADANGVQQKLNDGAMLDELVTPELKQELVATQTRDDQAIEALRDKAEGSGPEADAARTRMKQLMDERGVQVDHDGTVYSAKWEPTQNRADGNDFLTANLAVSRRDRPTPQEGQPPTTLDTNATFNRDGSRRTETLLSTIPTGKPGEVVQTHKEVVNTDPEFKITSSQVVEGQTKKNPDGTTAVDESTTDFNAEGKPTQTLRRTGTRDGEGPTDASGFLVSKDRSENKVTYGADGTPSVAEGTTWYGQADPENDPAKVDTSKTTFWPGTDVPKQTDVTSTITTKPEDDDDPIVDTTKTTTDFADTGIPTQTFVARTHTDPEHEFDLPQRELTVWNEDGTPKTRVAGGAVTSQYDLEQKAANPDTANLLQGDQLGSLDNREVRTIDPNTPIPDGHGLPNDWKRGDDGRWDAANPNPELAPPLKPSIDSKSAFDIPQQLKAASVAATLDAEGPKPGTAEFDQLVARQQDYQTRMGAAPDDAARERIQREYFESNDYWVEPGEPPVLMAAAYTQGVPNSAMWGSERQKQPHAVLARSGIAGQTEDGASTTTDYQARLYRDNTRDDIYKTTTTAQGTPPTTEVVNEHRGTTGLLERRQSTTEGKQTRAAEGKPPIEFKTVVDEEFDTTAIDPATGEPTLRKRREANAQWDNQTTSLTERTDELAGGKLVDTKITETTQSRDYDQGVVDEFLKGQHLAFYDGSHGDFNTGDHTEVKTPPVGSFRTTRTTDVDYDAGGVAVYSESKQSDVNVQARSNDDGTADDNGVLLVSSEQTSKYGSKGGTTPIFDEEGNPVVEGTFEKTLKTSEFDPDEGAAGGNKDKDFQYRHQTEVSSSGTLTQDGTPTNVKWTPSLDETLQEGHDDDSIYVRDLYATDPATGRLLVDDDGQPVELRYGSEVYDRQGNKHVLGQTDGKPIDIPLGANPDNFAWKSPLQPGMVGYETQTFGGAEHKDQDFADDAEDFYEAVGSKAVLVGGIALAVGGVVAAPFSGGLSLGLTVAGVGLAATDFGFQALNYRQGDIDGGDLAWSGAGLGLSVIPGAKLVTAGAKSARAGQAVLRGGEAIGSTTRAGTSTFARNGSRIGQGVDDALNPRLTRAYQAHPGLTETLAKADRYLPNWAMGNTGQALTNSPLIINGGLQLQESVQRDGWTFENILAATSVGLGLGAPVASAGHLRLYRNPTSSTTRPGLPSGADRTPAPRNPNVTGTDDPNVFAPGRAPELTPAPTGPDGVPLVTDAQPPRSNSIDLPASRPAVDAAPTSTPDVGGVRGGGAEAPAPAPAPDRTAAPTTAPRATQQHASELQQKALPRLAAGSQDVAARSFTGTDGVARVAIADRSANRIYVLRDGALEGVAPFDSPDGAAIAAASRAGQALPPAQVRALAAAPMRLALDAAPVPPREPASAPVDTVDAPPRSVAESPADVTDTATIPRPTFVEATPRSTQLDGAAGYVVENGTPRNLTLHRDIEGGGAYLLDGVSGLRVPATPQVLRSVQLDHRSSLPVGDTVSFERNGARMQGTVLEHRADGSTLVRGADGTQQTIATHDLFAQNLGGLLAGRTFTARGSVVDPTVALPVGERVRLLPDATARRFGLDNELFTVVAHRGNGEVVVRNAAGRDQTVLGDSLVDVNIAQVLGGRTFTTTDGAVVRVDGGDPNALDVSVVRGGVATRERWTSAQLHEQVPSLRTPTNGTVSVVGHDGRMIRVVDSRGGAARTYDVDADQFSALVPDHAAQMLTPRLRYDNQTAVIGTRGLDGRSVDPAAIADARAGRSLLRRNFDPYASDLLPNPNTRLRETFDEFGQLRASVDPTYRVPRRGYLDAMPRAGSIEQGNLGDCFLLASLNEHIARNPEAAASMVTQRADGNIAVRLGNRTIVVSPELPHVKGNLAFARGLGDNRALMAAYVEKAIAATSPDGYQALQGGNPNVATAFLRGETPTTRAASTDAEFVQGFLAEMATPSAMEHTVGTFGAFNVDPATLTPAARARIARVQELGLVPGHAYSVARVYGTGDGRTIIDLHNPWGRGHVSIDARDFATVASGYSAGSVGVVAPNPGVLATGTASADATGGFQLQSSANAATPRSSAPW